MPTVVEEFTRDAVALVLDEGRSIVRFREVRDRSDEPGNWVRQEQIDRGERASLTASERADLVELRRENAWLRMELDLLKQRRPAG